MKSNSLGRELLNCKTVAIFFLIIICKVQDVIKINLPDYLITKLNIEDGIGTLITLQFTMAILPTSVISFIVGMAKERILGVPVFQFIISLNNSTKFRIYVFEQFCISIVSIHGYVFMHYNTLLMALFLTTLNSWFIFFKVITILNNRIKLKNDIKKYLLCKKFDDIKVYIKNLQYDIIIYIENKELNEIEDMFIFFKDYTINHQDDYEKIKLYYVECIRKCLLEVDSDLPVIVIEHLKDSYKLFNEKHMRCNFYMSISNYFFKMLKVYNFEKYVQNDWNGIIELRKEYLKNLNNNEILNVNFSYEIIKHINNNSKINDELIMTKFMPAITSFDRDNIVQTVDLLNTYIYLITIGKYEIKIEDKNYCFNVMLFCGLFFLNNCEKYQNVTGYESFIISLRNKMSKINIRGITLKNYMDEHYNDNEENKLIECYKNIGEKFIGNLCQCYDLKLDDINKDIIYKKFLGYYFLLAYILNNKDLKYKNDLDFIKINDIINEFDNIEFEYNKYLLGITGIAKELIKLHMEDFNKYIFED